MDFSSCPFCSSIVPSSDIERHANGHFEDEEMARDMDLAQQIALAPASPPRPQVLDYGPGVEILSISGVNEFVEKDALSVNGKASTTGNDDDTLYLISFQMRAIFHEIDGGLLALLRDCLELEAGDSTCILSGHVDHIQSTKSEDVGWDCGWRNIQMLSSHLISERREAREVLYGGAGFVPDILSLQRWLEIAWDRRFDAVGAEHFNHRIYGTQRWIGTTECAAPLRSFGLRARIVDFGPKKLEALFLSIPGSKTGSRDETESMRGKRNVYQIYGPMDRYLTARKSNVSEAVSCAESPECSHSELDKTACSTSCGDKARNFTNTIKGQRVLVDWVWNYFSGGTPIETGRRKVTVSNKLPLYFQHDGHSRTIVGIQVNHNNVNGKQQHNLLVLDPGHKTEALERSLRRNSGWQKLIKRGVHTLRKPQDQLLYVDPGIATGEELEQLKMIDSMYIEF